MMNEEKIVKHMRGGDASALTDGRMTDVRSYLRDVRHRYRYAQTLCERASRYREMATRATGRMDALRLSGTSRRSKVEDNVLAMVDVHRELKEKIRELLEETRRAEKLICTLSDERYHAVLQLRYLCGMSWEEVAQRLHFSVRWVHKLHGEGLKQLAQHWTHRGH